MTTPTYKQVVTGPCPECGRDVLLCWGDNDECTAEPQDDGGEAELEATLAALPNVTLTEADYAEGERRGLRWVR